ncbi:uncharacterized protein [Eurosta solidaginis]|uniref:uncharacterized protein n=1 Tax=Eurosta solidaginis TaxID=178769 RepID=UPI0035313FA6
MLGDMRLLLNPEFVPEQLFTPIANCSWRPTEPTFGSYVIYAFVVPILATFGLCANFMNAVVFMRPKMSPSAFSYLAALSWLDCFSCLLITFTALSRSIFYGNVFWMTYDFQCQIPLFGISTGAANLLLAALSCDRWFYLRYGVANGCGQPRFCRRKVARRIIVVILFVAVLLNIPYFFVFVVHNDATFGIRELYVTNYYKIHNWVSFIMLSLLPALFLIIGHVAIIIAFRRWTNQSRKCRKYGQCSAKTTQKRYQHQMKLTITIIVLIVLYMIGEMPAALTSRKSSLNLLFGGDTKRVDLDAMSRVEMICLTLNALQLSMNILVYALINPSFMSELFSCLRGVSDFCCNMPFLTTLLGNIFCKAKEAKLQDGKEVKECEYGNEADARIECVETRKCDDDNGSANSNWEMEPEDSTNEVDYDMDSKHCRKSTIPQRNGHNNPSCSRVWNVDVAWHRSVAPCVKITHNVGDQRMMIDKNTRHINTMGTEQVKRHIR